MTVLHITLALGAYKTKHYTSSFCCTSVNPYSNGTSPFGRRLFSTAPGVQQRIAFIDSFVQFGMHQTQKGHLKRINPRAWKLMDRSASTLHNAM